MLFSAKGKFLIALLALLFGAPAMAGMLDGVSKMKFSALKRIKADSWNIVGKNIIVRGNVYVPFGDLEIYADQAVINVDSKDVEATGNIQFFRWMDTSGSVSPEKLARLESAPNILVTVTGVTGDIWGDQSISIKGSGLSDNLRADRIVGNLETGYFQFEKAQLKFKTFVCRAESGERKADGVIEVRNAEVSSCEYLEHDNGHYSISCSEARLTPHVTEFYGIDNLDSDPGDHTIFLVNGFWKIYGVPILWLPVFYKPKDESPGLFSVQWGESSDWGYYVLLSKRFLFYDYPGVLLKTFFDIYEQRGFGYGAELRIETEESRTAVFGYSIYDRDRYETDDYQDYRLKIPYERFNFRITNLTHITPRLDFRGVFDMSSDRYFLRDFFSTRYNSDPTPSTYAALEQQFDHFSAALYIRPKVNSFYTTVERLPEFRIDVPRQELFGTNVYYQGDLSLDYLKMDWIKFNREPFNPRTGEPLKGVNQKLRNYESFRFDTTHFLYYPLRWDWLTVVPRAGFKVTGYSDSSKGRVGVEDLLAQFEAADPQGNQVMQFRNYDRDGGSRVRFAGEFGVEASTKIHNSWQNIRSAWFQVDGLRHVMQPYLNYTFIPRPSEDRDHLYYFDEIDRIDEENFVRLGVNNRLQTRSGSGIKDLLTMENYIDLYLNKADGFNNVGDFCTILTATPFKGVTVSTMFAIDAGGNNEDLPPVMRNGRKLSDRPGIGLKWLNRWNLSLSYSPIEDVKFTLSYTYNRPYSTRSAYSMGSTLTQLEAGNFFDKYYTDYTEELNFGVSMPLTPDRRTFGAYTLTYDVLEGRISGQTLNVIRNFHCWDLIFSFEFERDDDDDKRHPYKMSYSFSARLTGLEGPLQVGQNQVLANADRQMRSAGAFGAGNGWKGF